MTSPQAQHSHPGDFHMVDLFAGPGGLDVAARLLGVESTGIEWDANACETRYAAGLRTLHADVSTVRQQRFADLSHDFNVLSGGPPCQTFSVAGKGAGRRALEEVKGFITRLVDGNESPEVIDKELADLGDPRTALVLEPLRWLMAAIEADKPYEAIILEQVPTVLPLWQVYKDVLESGRLPRNVRYQAECDVLRTEEYGVPQSRRRAVLIARLDRKGKVSLPTPTHHAFLRPKADAAPTLDSALDPDPAHDAVTRVRHRRNWVSMGQALASTSKELGRPASFVVVSNYGSGGDPRNRGRRLSSEPAFTVTGKVSRNTVIAEDGRTLPRFTISESGLLQTFPHNFPWSGRDQAQQVGNAVPPRFGVHLIAAALGLDEAHVKSALAKMDSWPAVSPEVTEELRRYGCGDRSTCPPRPLHPSSHHP
ncbi:DNA cytosine methyltransferase [Streptomyces sp. NPDC001135]